jgi:hypothetical protein
MRLLALAGLARFHLHPQTMDAHSTKGRFLRTVLAAVFAFMTLFHGPVMTFAKTAPPAPEAARLNQTGHHHHRHGTMPAQRQPADTATLPACNGFGCFVLVEALAVRLPAAFGKPIGTLLPGIAQAMHPADIEPVVPPPRLRV